MSLQLPAAIHGRIVVLYIVFLIFVLVDGPKNAIFPITSSLPSSPASSQQKTGESGVPT
jgi:hypothetical protein